MFIIICIKVLNNHDNKEPNHGFFIIFTCPEKDTLTFGFCFLNSIYFPLNYSKYVEILS